MDENDIPEQVDQGRRRFLSTAGTAALAAGAAGLAVAGTADPQAATAKQAGRAAVKPGHNVPQEAPRAFAEAVMKVDSF